MRLYYKKCLGRAVTTSICSDPKYDLYTKSITVQEMVQVLIFDSISELLDPKIEDSV